MHVVGDTQFHAGMPAGAVKDEHDLLACPSAHVTGKGGQFDLEERNRDTRGEMEDGAARGRMDEAADVAPGIVVLDWSDWPLAARRPDAAQDGLEANAMLVGRPELDARAGKRGRQAPQERAEFILKAACAAGSAWVWAGRGTWGLCRSRWR